MTKIKFNTNSKLKCVCGHKLRITEIKADGVEFEGEDEGACAPTTEGAAGGGHAVPWEDEGYAGVPATAVWGAAEERTAALQSVLAVLGS